MLLVKGGGLKRDLLYVTVFEYGTLFVKRFDTVSHAIRSKLL